MPKNNILKSMGVINITPNSFSDGGESFSAEKCISKINELLNLDVQYLDFGAESTAPFNSKIDSKEEIERFENILFPSLVHLDIPENVRISIDTYRPETFKRVYDEISKNFVRPLIWNDVSGVIDNEVFNILKECPNSEYVFSHNNVNSRDDVLNHMDYCNEGDIVSQLSLYFEKGLEQFKANGLEERVILDPCFGFSKTYEQNLDLIKNIEILTSKFNNTWLLGISKKSFLRKFLNVSDSNNIEIEVLHGLILSNWAQKITENEVIIRLHDPSINATSNKYLLSLQ